MSEFKIIGCVSGYNEDDKRCNEHADFSFAGRSIYTGEDFSCTYCGDEWKDGLTAQERYERKHNVKHCDSCLSFQPPFAGDKCDLCVAESLAATVPPVELDSDDTMDMTREDVSWSIKVTRQGEFPVMTLMSEYWEGVRVEIDFTTHSRWFLGITVNGDSVYSLTAADSALRSLAHIIEHGMSVAEQYDPDMVEYRYDYRDDYDYEPGDSDYDQSDPYDIMYDVY